MKICFTIVTVFCVTICYSQVVSSKYPIIGNGSTTSPLEISSSPTNGYILKWDTGLGKWLPSVDYLTLPFTGKGSSFLFGSTFIDLFKIESTSDYEAIVGVSEGRAIKGEGGEIGITGKSLGTKNLGGASSIGVFGNAFDSNVGVNSIIGVMGEASRKFNGSSTIGVWGKAIAEARSLTESIGVRGDATGGKSIGVFGTTNAGIGVQGISQSFYGVEGYSESHTGVKGTTRNLTGGLPEIAGVAGFAIGNGNASGVYGEINSLSSSSPNSKGNAGVYGRATQSAHGVIGESKFGIGVKGYGRTGVYGEAHRIGKYADRTEHVYGVKGIAFGKGKDITYGIYGKGDGGSNNTAGYFEGSIYTTGIFIASDEKIKYIYNKYENALDDLSKINVYNYSFNQHMPLNLPQNEKIGISAQEIEKVFPYMVKNMSIPIDISSDEFEKRELDEKQPESDMDFKTLNYIDLIPVLLQAINQLNIENKKLKGEISEIKKALSEIKK